MQHHVIPDIVIQLIHPAHEPSTYNHGGGLKEQVSIPTGIRQRRIPSFSVSYCSRLGYDQNNTRKGTKRSVATV